MTDRIVRALRIGGELGQTLLPLVRPRTDDQAVAADRGNGDDRATVERTDHLRGTARHDGRRRRGKRLARDRLGGQGLDDRVGDGPRSRRLPRLVRANPP